MTDRALSIALLPLLATACAPDLPEDWADALLVPTLTQGACDGDPYAGDPDERLEAEGGAGQATLHYLEAHFRCEQDVEAFYLLDGDALSVLVQPIDMDPSMVAACDCLYDIDMEIPDLPAGALTVELFRRWDNINDDNDPVAIGSAEIEIAE
jgi:hypothetical protein